MSDRLGDAGADHDAMQPGVEAIRVAESGQVTPGDHQRVLHGILGPVDVAEDPLRDREEPVATRADQVGVCLPVPALCGLHEITIHCAVPRVSAQRGRRPTLWGPRGWPSVHELRRPAHPEGEGRP